MHGDNVSAQVWRDFSVDGGGQVAGRESCDPAVVDVYDVRGVVLVERGIRVRDDLPGVRVGGRFAREVAGVELDDGAVEVVGIERDQIHYQPVGIDLGDRERFGMECVRPRVASVVEGTSEREALPADREDVRCQTLSPNVCDRADRRDGGLAVVAFVAESSTPVLEPDVVGEQLSYLVPAPVGKERVKPIVGSTRGVLE